MSVARSYSAQLSGISSEKVTVEVDISNGLHAFSIVGLGDRAVEEAKDRISAAIKNSGYISPKQKNQKVVISLAPADVRKEGTAFDLPMAIAYLAAAGDISFDAEKKLFLGELSLEGELRKVTGLLPLLRNATAGGFKEAYVPSANSREASLAEGIAVYAVSSLRESIACLTGEINREFFELKRTQIEAPPPSYPDMKSVRGNETAKRALEIAAAGGHNLLMCGPPGTGKTMLANSFPSILPPLSYDHAVEVTSIHSAARALGDNLIAHPPFRAPHHASSHISIIGGYGAPRPGEISLAHRGVLFMDEFPEFDREVLEALRQPLEEKVITIRRARGSVTFPANCILLASMNPCPCGRGKERGCMCRKSSVEAYRRRISGPIADRIDLWIDVNQVDHAKMSAREGDGESSESIRARVVAARKLQEARCARNGISAKINGELEARELELCAEMEDEARIFLAASSRKLELSGRGVHRVMKIARTIADLAVNVSVKKEHVLEALQYRKRTV
jgi:magnesium chelatase family protein